MARSNQARKAVAGGVRKRRTTQPRMSGGADSTIIEYSAIGSTVTTGSAGDAAPRRLYVPGNANGLSSSIGPTVAGFYSCAKFLPGTKIRWEPAVSFTTPGRIYVGFTDNPEVISTLEGLTNIVTYTNAVKGLGSVVSFPVWQETDIPFPSRTRRKMFDTNTTVINDVNILDRSAQVGFFVAVEGVGSTQSIGSFWYHDKVMVEGLQPIVT